MSITEIGPKISEALVSTALGLGVAIIGAMSFNFFTSRVEQLRHRHERRVERVHRLRAARGPGLTRGRPRRTFASPLAALGQEGAHRSRPQRHQRDAARRRHARAAHHLHADDDGDGARPGRDAAEGDELLRRRRTRCSRSSRSTTTATSTSRRTSSGRSTTRTLKEMEQQIQAAWAAPKNPEGVGRVYIKGDGPRRVRQGLPGPRVPQQGARTCSRSISRSPRRKTRRRSSHGDVNRRRQAAASRARSTSRR